MLCVRVKEQGGREASQRLLFPLFLAALGQSCALRKRERFLHPRQQQRISLASFHFGSVNIQERTFSSGGEKPAPPPHAQGPLQNIFAACKIHFWRCLLLLAPLGTNGGGHTHTKTRARPWFIHEFLGTRGGVHAD